MIRGFIIMIGRQYVRWNKDKTIHDLVSDPEHASWYATTAEAMQARPWIRDLDGEQHPYQIGVVVPLRGAINDDLSRRHHTPSKPRGTGNANKARRVILKLPISIVGCQH